MSTVALPMPVRSRATRSHGGVVLTEERRRTVQPLRVSGSQKGSSRGPEWFPTSVSLVVEKKKGLSVKSSSTS